MGTLFKRKLVSQICQRLAEPRQTGKTTAVLQALEECGLQNRFASADDPNLNSMEWIRSEWEEARLEQNKAKGEVGQMVLCIQSTFFM